MNSKSLFKTLVFGFILFLIVFGSSCRKDFDFKMATNGLEFSKDTVFLDTVFTNIGSSTYTLKVYNQEDEDVLIPFIGLEKGEESNYRLNVDGLAGKTFNDIPLLAKDSLFIFIETTFDITTVGETEFLYTDAIQFQTGGNTQQVELITLVRDAIFLYPQRLPNGMKESIVLGEDLDGNEIRVEGFYLDDDELSFTREKPYVIYGYATAKSGNTLTFDAGTRVFFHKNSGILIEENAQLFINGALSEDQEVLENAVIFEGDRLQPEFAEVPGQWGTIWLLPGSTGHQIEHLILKNATVGLLVDGTENDDTPTLTLNNSQLFNSSNSNLWARTANINATNTVLGNAGSASFYANLGGQYDFKHCTIANYWTNGFRSFPALLIDNFILFQDGSSIASDLVKANFSNCIIDGNKNLELLLVNNEINAFNFAFLNCSIQFNDINNDFVDNPFYDFSDTNFYENSVQNIMTKFIDARNNRFQLNEDSEAIDRGNIGVANQVPIDLQGNSRTASPDLGAYEFILQN
ncbi:MAG: hypothetical protein HKP38_12490 [Croceitalea sp.]|nr:hypothetical protein [Croceitalea sp.]